MEPERQEVDSPRPEKLAVVKEVAERVSESAMVFLTEYRGLRMADLQALRGSLAEVGGQYKVYKNTLVRFAFQDLGLTTADHLLTGPTAVAFARDDASGVARALRDYARANPALVVKGALLGSDLLTPERVQELADLPPREVMLARLAGTLAAPLQQLMSVLSALPRGLAVGLAAVLEQKQAAGAGGQPEVAEAPPAGEAEASEGSEHAAVSPSGSTTSQGKEPE